MTISTNRVEAFSDCVISIVITIMVFDIKLPDSVKHMSNKNELKELLVLAPQLTAYLFSFTVLGIMWLNHHHLFHIIQKADEKFLWLNLHLLFWLSLIPFPTDLLGEAPFLTYSAAIYGVILFMASFAFLLLRGYAIRHYFMYVPEEKVLNKTLDKLNKRATLKNYIGMVAYLLSIPASFWSIYAAYACFTVAPILFFIPDGIDDEVLAEKVVEGGQDASKIYR
jgi:TMEM175 potassium channel family protein